MTALWLVLAFLGGIIFTWHVAGRLLYKALNRSLTLERALGRMDYEALLRTRDAVEREIGKRRATEPAA